jgi:hypothetical protein
VNVSLPSYFMCSLFSAFIAIKPDLLDEVDPVPTNYFMIYEVCGGKTSYILDQCSTNAHWAGHR